MSFLLALMLGSSVASAQCPASPILGFKVLRTIHRTSPGFTEGLIYLNGFLYESVGGYGASAVQRIDPRTGNVDRLAELSSRFFGEGMDSRDQILYQLTWKENEILSWTLDGGFLGAIFYPYDGWGLTRDPHGGWITSDGSNVLHFFDPDWEPERNVTVHVDSRSQLNELEFARGSVWANVFTKTLILRIDPSSGCVQGTLDLGPLVSASGVDLSREPNDVLNGVAYRADHGSFYVTGKDWGVIYEIGLEKSGLDA